MLWIRSYFSSSVGRKQVLALMGIFLNLFLIVHLIGNSLVLLGSKSFNIYAHTLISNPFIYFAEAGLVVVFVLHIFLGLKLVWDSYKVRPVKYMVYNRGNGGATFASRMMPWTGILILVYLVFHLLSFKYGKVYWISYDGSLHVRDLYHLLVVSYGDPFFLVINLFFAVVIFFHLLHGVPSILDTIGLTHPKYDRLLEWGCKIYASGLSMGFFVIPLGYYYWASR